MPVVERVEGIGLKAIKGKVVVGDNVGPIWAHDYKCGRGGTDFGACDSKLALGGRDDVLFVTIAVGPTPFQHHVANKDREAVKNGHWHC